MAGSLHAAGELHPAAHGIWEGEIAFPIRGTIPFRIEGMPAEDTRIRCFAPGSEAGGLVSNGRNVWRGTVSVEGYPFDVQVLEQPAKAVVRFYDGKEPE